MLRYWMAFGLVMLACGNPANRRCFAQSPSLQPSTAEQINFLQQQIDQLKLDAGIAKPAQPVWFQQPPGMSGVPSVPAPNMPELLPPLPATPPTETKVPSPYSTDLR